VAGVSGEAGGGYFYPDSADDARGTWTITLEGGPAEAPELATAIRAIAPASAAIRSLTTLGALARLVIALERAQFTPAEPG
jgi:hypothetical protein